MTGLHKELKYHGDIKGVYIYIAEAVINHTWEHITVSIAKS
jgi:hypothetical protein